MNTDSLNAASCYLLSLARQHTGAYVAACQVQAAMVTGSVAEGLSDEHSDVDLILSYDALPSEAELQAAGRQNGAADRRLLGTSDAEGSRTGTIEVYRARGVEFQVVHQTIAAWEADMAMVREQFDPERGIEENLHAVRQLEQSLLPVGTQHVGFGGRAGRGLAADALERDAAQPRDEMGQRLAVCRGGGGGFRGPATVTLMIASMGSEIEWPASLLLARIIPPGA